MPIWIKDGKLVVDAAGKPIECEECPCDGADCVYYAGDFSVDQDPLDTDLWTESAGDWAIASGVLITSDDDARVRMDIGGISISRPIDQINIKVQFKLTASGGEFIVGSVTTAGSDASCVVVRVGASARIICSAFDASRTYYDQSVTAAANTIHTLEIVCGRVYLNTAYVFNIARATTTANLFIGTLDLAGGDLEVSELILYKDSSLGPDESCTDCITCSTLLDDAPATVDVVVAGFTDFGVYPLSNMNGTYTLTKCSGARGDVLGCVYTLGGLNILVYDEFGQHYITTARLLLQAIGNVLFTLSSEALVACDHNLFVSANSTFQVDSLTTDVDVSDGEFTMPFIASWDSSFGTILSQPQPITAKIQL